MDFKTAISSLLRSFEAQSIRYGLMGGFALGLWGVTRSTVDLDFLVHRDDLGRIDAVMKELGYDCRFRSENVSQFVSPLRIFGEVDFLHAFRQTSLEMLSRAEKKNIFGNEMSIKVLLPEDLIGLKLQAIKNDPLRKEQDAADIRALCTLRRGKLDLQLLRQYGEILDARELLRECVEL